MEEELELQCGPCCMIVRVVYKQGKVEFTPKRKLCCQKCIDNFVRLVSNEGTTTEH